MAVYTNTQTVYDAAGIKEDLTNIIEIISPVETFLTSKSGNVPAKNTLHEWQTDALATPTAVARVEGATRTPTAITATSRVNNRTQIIGTDFSVTEPMESVETAGRASQVAYQKSLKTKDLANFIEYAMVINSSAVSGDTATARQMKGALGAITTNVSSAEAAREISADIINELMGTAWAAGARAPFTAICGDFQKRKLSNALSNINTRDISAEKNTVSYAVDVYKSDHGALTIVPHHIMNSAAADKILIFGEMRLWRKAWLRKPNWKQLPVTARVEFWDVETELTLEYGNEKGAAKITNLTTS